MEFDPVLDFEVTIEHEIDISASLELDITGRLNMRDEDEPMCTPIGKPIGLLGKLAEGATSGTCV
jgi:hypothetical protein